MTVCSGAAALSFPLHFSSSFACVWIEQLRERGKENMWLARQTDVMEIFQHMAMQADHPAVCEATIAVWKIDGHFTIAVWWQEQRHCIHIFPHLESLKGMWRSLHLLREITGWDFLLPFFIYTAMCTRADCLSQICGNKDNQDNNIH